MQLKNGGTAVFGHSYTYDAMSRLATVGNGSATASYTRVPGSSALASTVLGVVGGGDVMTTTRAYDNKSRLTGITSTAGATSRGFNYQYDDKDQRIKCTLADGSWWEYAYWEIDYSWPKGHYTAVDFAGFSKKTDMSEDYTAKFILSLKLVGDNNPTVHEIAWSYNIFYKYTSPQNSLFDGERRVTVTLKINE